MTDGRDAFLRRVREAVRAGNRPGQGAGGADATPLALPERGQIGYQGAGPDPLARFAEEFRGAGGQPHRVTDVAAAVARVLELVRARSAGPVLLGRGPLLDRLELAPALGAAGVAVTHIDKLPAESTKDAFFAAAIGITEADYLIAETGSIVQAARIESPRSGSLLPPVHIVVADRRHLLPDLFDLFPALGAAPPSAVAVITGPSKTGDIELKLVTGVHGPGAVHVVFIEG